MVTRDLRVFGRVVDEDTGEGIPGLLVEVFDKDRRYDDRLGTATTDSDGEFEVTYDEADFAESATDRKPDLYLRIKTASGKEIHTTEDSVRSRAGDTEEFVVRVPNPEPLESTSRPVPRRRAGVFNVVRSRLNRATAIFTPVRLKLIRWMRSRPG